MNKYLLAIFRRVLFSIIINLDMFSVPGCDKFTTIANPAKSKKEATNKQPTTPIKLLNYAQKIK